MSCPALRFSEPPTVVALAAFAVFVAVSSPSRAAAQATPPTGLEFGGVPAINFDADEGFGYGAIAELYQYGPGGLAPYVWTLQPTVFLTTGGRRDFTLFFDAPHLLSGGWRLSAFAGSEEQIATPYYGVGNATPYDAALEADAGPDPFFYRFGRARRTASVTLQRPLGTLPVRGLLGAALVRTTMDPVPEDDGTTLFASELGGADVTEWMNSVRAGIVWDTRDRETGPTRGTWTELLVERVDASLGADASFTRWVFTDRRYLSLADGLVLAHRLLLQDASEGAPVHELHRVLSSFKQQEGLGGAKTVRGVLKNRFVGRGLLVWNAELRWRVADFRLAGRAFHAVVSAYVDHGRVWADGVRLDELVSDLHRGAGGGLRIGMGENFVVAVDVGTSDETSMPLYIGLGYLY